MRSESDITVAQAKPHRLCELDCLRAIAILLIVMVHSGAYASHLRVPAGAFLAELGLSVFFFISGYALTANYGAIRNAQDVRRFLVKRVLKIYPLYLPALFSFVVLFHYWGLWHRWDITPVIPTTIAHVLGSQVLLSPVVTPINTLWFVGCIVLYYLVYLALARYGCSNKRLIVTSIVVFLLFTAIKVMTGLVEYRFFYYYPVFVGSVVAGRARVLDRSMSGKGRIAGVLGGLVAMFLLARAPLAHAERDTQPRGSFGSSVCWGREPVPDLLPGGCGVLGLSVANCHLAPVGEGQGSHVVHFCVVVCCVPVSPAHVCAAGGFSS